jgi:hypothetical protein
MAAIRNDSVTETVTNETAQIHTELIRTLAKRFPHETPNQLQDRALRVIALGEKLKRALPDFWAQNPRREKP